MSFKNTRRIVSFLVLSVISCLNISAAQTLQEPVRVITTPDSQDLFLFGISLGLNSNSYFIGALHSNSRFCNNTGAVLQYSRQTGQLIRTYCSPRQNTIFGETLAVNDQYLLIADRTQYGNDLGDDGAVFVYNPSTGALLRTIKYREIGGNSPNQADFGLTVAIGETRFFIGSPRDHVISNNETTYWAGAVYSVPMSGGAVMKINHPAPVQSAYFAQSLATKGDQLLVSALRGTGDLDQMKGRVYLINGSTGAVEYERKAPDNAAFNNFGKGLAFIPNGFAVSDEYANGFLGRTYLYDISGNLNSQINNPFPSPATGFGAPVISGNGLIIGHPGFDENLQTNDDRGSAHLFNPATGQRLARFKYSGSERGDKISSTIAGGFGQLMLGAPSAVRNNRTVGYVAIYQTPKVPLPVVAY